MNAIELLKSDHEVVKRLFEKVEATEESEHLELFEQIKQELETHTHIEETIFYPKLKAEGDQELIDIVLEGIEEHHQAKMFLRELSSLVEDSEKFDPKLKVLRKMGSCPEEEGEMFSGEEQFDARFRRVGANWNAEKANFRIESAVEVERTKEDIWCKSKSTLGKVYEKAKGVVGEVLVGAATGAVAGAATTAVKAAGTTGGTGRPEGKGKTNSRMTGDGTGSKGGATKASSQKAASKSISRTQALPRNKSGEVRKVPQLAQRARPQSLPRQGAHPEKTSKCESWIGTKGQDRPNVFGWKVDIGGSAGRQKFSRS